MGAATAPTVTASRSPSHPAQLASSPLTGGVPTCLLPWNPALSWFLGGWTRHRHPQVPAVTPWVPIHNNGSLFVPLRPSEEKYFSSLISLTPLSDSLIPLFNREEQATGSDLGMHKPRYLLFIFMVYFYL